MHAGGDVDSGAGKIDQRRHPRLHDLPTGRSYTNDCRPNSSSDRLYDIHLCKTEIDVALGQTHLSSTAVRAPMQDAEPGFRVAVVTDVAEEYQVGRFELYVRLCQMVIAGVEFA